MKKVFWITMLILVAGSCKENRCSNGEQNKKEEGIDCGGPCEPCATCSDGIKNQDEVETDCGGACAACPIYYPETGTYGVNLLNDDTLVYSSGDISMRAELPEGSTLKLKLYSVSGAIWGYGGTETNIIISPPEGSTQIFEAVTDGLMQVRISLPAPSGSLVVEFYENSASPTKTKAISWE